MASPAMKEAYLELVPQFEKATGHKVVTTWAGTADVMKRIGGAGEVFDLVIVARKSLDELTAQGRIVPASRADLVKSGVGVAVRSGLPKPDISSGEAVKRAVLAAKSVVYSSGPSGVYISELFKRWGIAEEIKPKLTQVASGVNIGEFLASGKADLGFQQVSELNHVKGIEFVGPLPPDIQLTTVFSGGVHLAAKEPAPAKALLAFLATPDALAVIRKTGLEPGAFSPPAEVMNIVREEEIKWVKNPLVPGLATAVVHGDPKVPGKPYVVRVRFPPNTMSPPHFHPEARHIVVLKGTWWVGAGPKWDRDATAPVPAGSFVVHHPNQIHYDGAKDEEVLLQIVGVGPSSTTPVDESGRPKQ